MRFILAVLLVTCASAAQVAPSAPARQDVVLADGRVIKNVVSVVRGDNGLSLVTEVITEGKRSHEYTTVSRADVPADFLAPWESYLDGAKRKNEERQRARELEREETQRQLAERELRNKEARAKMNAANSAADSAGRAALARAEREVEELAKRPEREAAARARAEQARLADLARSPTGLFVVGFLPYKDGSGLAEVILVNRDTAPRKLDVAQLLGVQVDGDAIVAAAGVLFRVEERADLWLMPGQQRQFRVRFPGGRAVAALAWSTDSADWRTPGNPAPAVETAAEAARIFREALAAERVAKRAKMVGQ